ncbi:MAG: hypothetical protein O3A08_13175 [Proteobacteria bacterium]|nr:hypothetical protein [Pseudomonadota bacterium]MDA1287343.1 hypothetical protein [Pseudomonadota bacterium]
MERPSAGGLLGFRVVILVVQASLLLGKGVLLIEKHEGDALHVLEIVFRMSEGQWLHLDFMTPLGVLSFAPIVWLMSLGLGAGKAIMVSFVLFAAILLPALWWACYSRLSGWMAYAFGAVVIVMVSVDRSDTPLDTAARTAMPRPTMAAVRTTQSTVTAPDSSLLKFVKSFIVWSLQRIS